MWVGNYTVIEVKVLGGESTTILTNITEQENLVENGAFGKTLIKFSVTQFLVKAFLIFYSFTCF